MLKALADRLAEALAERLHERVRREFWGYAPEERFTNDELIARSTAASARRRATRPARTTPRRRRCGGCSTRRRNAGIRLTETFAMYPTAAVSGWYFSHPEARYFEVGKIDADQVEDYARRKGMTLAEAERWLAPILGYEPGRTAA